MDDARSSLGEGSAEGSNKKRKLCEDLESEVIKRSKATDATEKSAKIQNSGIENVDNDVKTDDEAIQLDSDSEPEENDIDHDSDEESLATDEVKSSIVDILNNSKKPTTHAVGKFDESIPLPNLVVDGFGYVPLPMHSLIANELVKHMERSPYGHGEKTITDPEYRNSFQLGPDKFHTKNQKFTEAVKKIVGTVAERFYFSSSNVCAKLYKFLLYEPGGLFKPHKDTEKENGMFATLIIQLPSVFTGGQFRVLHNGKTKTFDLSQQGSDVNTFYIAHFASCTHELTQIESGYRVALVYNLCWTGNASTIPTAPSQDLTVAETLRALISSYLQGRASRLVVWLLEHDYTDESLRTHGLKALKGKDAFVVKQLMETNEDQKEDDLLEILMAKATKHEEGSCETHEGCGYGRYGWYDGGDECEMGECLESETALTNFLCLSESKPACLFKRLSVDPEEDVLNFEDDEEFWGEPDRDECGGPTGNEGATMERWYSRRVLVVFFKSEELTIAFCANPDLAIKKLLQGMKPGRKLTDVEKNCVLACMFTSSQVPDITLLAFKNEELDFVKQVVIKISKTNEGFGSGSERKELGRYQRQGSTSEQEAKEDETGLTRCLKLYKTGRGIEELEPYLLRMIQATGERKDLLRAQECLRVVDEILPTKDVYGHAIFELFFERMTARYDYDTGKSKSPYYEKALKFLMIKYPDIIPAKWETMVKSSGLCHPSVAVSLIPVFQNSNLSMRDQIIERMITGVLEFVLPKWTESSKRTGYTYSHYSTPTFQVEIQKLTQILSTKERLMQMFCAKFSPNAHLDCVGNWIDWVFEKNIQQLIASPRFRPVVENRIKALKLQTAEPIPELDSQYKTKKGEVRRTNAAQRAVQARNAKIEKRNKLINTMNKLQEKLKSMRLY